MFCGIFAGTRVICCWNRLFLLLQSNLMEFDVRGIFAGTRVNYCWNRLSLLLQSNLLEFDVRGIFAGTRVNYCWNRLFLLLHPFMTEIRPGRDGERCLVLLQTITGVDPVLQPRCFLLQPTTAKATN